MAPASYCVACWSERVEEITAKQTDTVLIQHRRCSDCGCEWTCVRPTGKPFLLSMRDRRGNGQSHEPIARADAE